MKKIFLLFIFLIVLYGVSAQCVENWYCTSWGDCRFGRVTRTCEDVNNCDTSYNKPETKMDCSMNLSFLWIVMLVVIVVLVLLIIFRNKIHFKKRKPKLPYSNIGELELYIRTAITDGASMGDIRKNLINAGWVAEIIDKALSKYKNIKLGRGNLSIAENIQMALKKGFSKSDIKKQLLHKGWPEDKVDQILKMF